MKNLNKQKGFTLIELLVVVSIIALLSSVVVAGLTDARGGAKNNKRNELARQYVTGLSLYHGEHGSYPERCDNCAKNTERVCLGEGYPNKVCSVIGQHSEIDSINDKVKEFVPSAPPSLESTMAGGENFYGISYKCTDANCIGYELSWIVEGGGSDAECFGGAEKTNTVQGVIGICTYSTNN